MPHHPESGISPDLGPTQRPRCPQGLFVQPLGSPQQREPGLLSPDSLAPCPVACDPPSPWSPLPHPHSRHLSIPVSVSPWAQVIYETVEGRTWLRTIPVSTREMRRQRSGPWRADPRMACVPVSARGLVCGLNPGTRVQSFLQGATWGLHARCHLGEAPEVTRCRLEAASWSFRPFPETALPVR